MAAGASPSFDPGVGDLVAYFHDSILKTLALGPYGRKVHARWTRNVENLW